MITNRTNDKNEIINELNSTNKGDVFLLIVAENDEEKKFLIDFLQQLTQYESGGG